VDDNLMEKISRKEDSIMCLPHPDPDTTFAELLQDLPPELEAMAREFKAFTRARKIKSPVQLLRAVLMYAGLDFTEREVAADLLLSDPGLSSLSDQSVRERLQACQPWIKALLPKLIAKAPLPELPSGLRLLVIDASDVTAPGEKTASWRLHIVIDLVSLQLVAVKITDHKTGETLRNYEFAQGDVVMTDRGYCQRQGVVHALSQGAEIIIRYNAHTFPFDDAAGKRLNLAAVLADLPEGSTRSVQVSLEVSEGQTRQAWIHAYRLSGEAAAAARRRCKRGGQKRGYTPRRETLFLAEFVLVLTTVSPEVLSAQTVLALYRCRWQVELLIKRWKSLLNLDQLRARAGSVLGELWIHGKLLYALLLERRLRRRCGPEWGRLDDQRTTTWWRLWKLMRQEIAPLISGVQHWTLSQWNRALSAVTGRRRKRKLQKIPSQVETWLRTPREKELASIPFK
jgi:hypothetical protein